MDPDRIEAVHRLIAPHVRVTPTLTVQGADLGTPPCTVVLKLELLQHAGSFKTRGAFANLLARDVPAAGVVAASGGNHGAAVAYAAHALGVPATVFVPEISAPAKVERIRAYGAHLVITGRRYADALAASEKHAADTGALPVPAFDGTQTLLGQATLGRELHAQHPDLDTVLVAVGGGGLIGGVAGWYRGRTRVVGVEPVEAPTLTAAFAAGGPADAPAGGIAADSLAPKRVGDLVYPIARQHVARVVTVDDAAIRAAQRVLWDRVRLVVEPGGATALAALLTGAHTPTPGERVGVVLSGANTTHEFS